MIFAGGFSSNCWALSRRVEFSKDKEKKKGRSPFIHG